MLHETKELTTNVSLFEEQPIWPLMERKKKLKSKERKFSEQSKTNCPQEAALHNLFHRKSDSF